jgi:hypothetical protein
MWLSLAWWTVAALADMAAELGERFLAMVESSSPNHSSTAGADPLSSLLVRARKHAVSQ